MAAPPVSHPAPEEPALACPGCGLPMRKLALRAHYGRPVEVDSCSGCRLVWFDGLESVQLSTPSWVELLLAFEDGPGAISPSAPQALGCPRCRRGLGEWSNQTRWGRFRSHGCPDGHGWLQTQTQLLSGRGLLRPPTLGERAAMATEPRAWPCLNCGAPTTGRGAACGHCDTPLMLFDLPRLFESLSPRRSQGLPVRGGRLHAWACHACAGPMDPTAQTRCPRCDHPAMAARVGDLRPLLEALRRAWQDAEQG